jgi:hypothetical protein
MASNSSIGLARNSAVIRAVEYVRMSAEHQHHSTENQQKVMRQYAEKYQSAIS